MEEEEDTLSNICALSLQRKKQSSSSCHTSTSSCPEEKEEVDEILLELCRLQDELREHLYQSHQFNLSIAPKVSSFFLFLWLFNM